MRRTPLVLLSTAIVLLSVARPATATPKSCPDDVLDNCYKRHEMTNFTRHAIDLVEEWMDTVGHGQPAAVRVIDTGHEVSDGCDDPGRYPVADSMAYYYCPLDNAIYIGLDQVWDFYTTFGAASPIIALAHEYGHAIQHAAGVPEPDTYATLVRLENQADCIAGTFAYFLQGKGLLEPRDLKNLAQFLNAIGSAEDPQRDHGTPAERHNAFFDGYSTDLAACGL